MVLSSPTSLACQLTLWPEIHQESEALEEHPRKNASIHGGIAKFEQGVNHGESY
jgi:hypothetical protein